MTTRVEWVRYGRPAATRLRAALAAAKDDDPLAEVAVVVPSNHVGVATRRLLASGELGAASRAGTGIAAVTFLTVYRLAELLGTARLVGADRRPVSTPVIAAAVRASLAEQPGVFGPVADHAATEGALVASYQDLRQVAPAALDRLADTSVRAADVVRLHRAARDHLRREHFDEEDLVAAAIEAIGDGATRLANLVVVYLPQRLSPHAALLLDAVGERTDVLVLAGTTGSPKADAGLSRRLAGLGVVPMSPPTGAPVVSPEGTRLVTTSDADEEVRTAVRAVLDAARDGTRLERVAVLYGAPDPYARIVHEQLAAAGIPHNGTAVVPLTARAAGRALLGLLGLPSTGFGREAVFTWLAGAPLRHDGDAVPVAAWEQLSREAGVVAGREQWDRLIATFAAEHETEAVAGDLEVPRWQPRLLRERATQARELRAFVLHLVDDLSDAAARPRRWSEHVAWARRHLGSLIGSERDLSEWPADEREAARRTEQALARLEALDRFEGPVDLEVFRRTLEAELQGDVGRLGRVGEGLTVGTIRMGVGLDLDLAVVLGLAEGSYPAPVRDDPLLPDHEREVAGGQLPLRSEETERQHHELLAVLAGARRHLLCMPRGNLRRNDERVPSRWLVDFARELAGERLGADDVLTTTTPWLDHVPSFEAGLRRVAFPATEQEHRLRALLARPRTATPDPLVVGAVGDPVLAAGAEMVAARRSPHFTRFDGNLEGWAVPSPVDGVTSATRLERWAVCPFAYFMREILGVDPVENPEDRLQISPLDLGTLVHTVLERFFGEVLARPLVAQPQPEDRWSEADRRRILEIGRATCDEYEAHGLVGRSLFWERDRRRILTDLERFLEEDSTFRATRGTRPVAAELSFGLPTAQLSSVGLLLPDGRRVELSGRADRLDAGTGGTLEVLDYKTGKPEGRAALGADRPDAGGRRLQLAVYALAARLHVGHPDAPVRSEYWFTSARGGFARVGYEVTPAVLERVSATVGQIVEGIETGAFPQYPGTGNGAWRQCPYCDPDGLGVADLRRRLERKRSDAALATFLALAESTGEADPGEPVSSGPTRAEVTDD